MPQPQGLALLILRERAGLQLHDAGSPGSPRAEQLAGAVGLAESGQGRKMEHEVLLVELTPLGLLDRRQQHLVERLDGGTGGLDDRAESESEPASWARADIDSASGTCNATLTAPKSNTVASADTATWPNTARSSGTSPSGNCQGVGR